MNLIILTRLHVTKKGWQENNHSQKNLVTEEETCTIKLRSLNYDGFKACSVSLEVTNNLSEGPLVPDGCNFHFKGSMGQ